MQHHVQYGVSRVQVGYSDLFIIGTNRTSTQGSDFTTAATSQTYSLMTLASGDIVDGHGIIDVRTAIAGTGITAVVGEVSVSGQQGLGVVNLASASSSYPTDYNATGGETIQFTITTTGGNVSAITAGQIWIFLNIKRMADRSRILA